MAPVRTIEVRPPSRRHEGFIVLMVATGIVLAALYSLALRVEAAQGVDEPARDSLPFQVQFADLPSPAQRTFRSLQEGFLEAQAQRTPKGVWPSATSLAAQGIPPFAADPTDKSGLQWSSSQRELLVNYLGVPAKGPLFLLVIVEPGASGERAGAAPAVDEEHRLLSDGTLLHVTYWMKTKGVRPDGLVDAPALEGWSQIKASQRPAIKEMK